MAVRRIEDIRPLRPAPKPRALPHLTPYVLPVQKRPQPPVTHITPAKAGPQAPVVRDGTLRSALRTGPISTPQPVRPKPVTVQHQATPKRPVPPARPYQLPATAHPTPNPIQTQAPDRTPAPVAKLDAPIKKPASKRRVAFELIQYPVFAAVALIAANNSTIGQWFVLAYAIIALVLRLRSQVSFGMALFLLVAIPVFQMLGQAGIAQNIAVYVYELLVVGTLQAVIELYKTRHHKHADA